MSDNAPQRPTPTIHNAKITSTFLGVEDHGIMTFFLYLTFNFSGIGYGGYGLDTHVPETKKRIATQGYQAIRHILETLELDRWERLPNTLCRVEFDNGRGLSAKILRIGHILDDKWFDLAAYMMEHNHD